MSSVGPPADSPRPPLAAGPSAVGPSTAVIRMVGPSGTLDVWLGAAAPPGLEADVRAVSLRGVTRLQDLAVALGDVARRHKLEVRVIPRQGSDGARVLVLFGGRLYRAR